LNVAQAAMAACKADGFDVTVAVVDRAGDLKVLLRATPPIPQCRYGATQGLHVANLQGAVNGGRQNGPMDPTELSGQRFLVDIIPLGGGVPINIGNDTIGALGISGSRIRKATKSVRPPRWRRSRTR
jgi:uncharacterized protein GlcG (DUF336 family)